MEVLYLKAVCHDSVYGLNTLGNIAVEEMSQELRQRLGGRLAQQVLSLRQPDGVAMIAQKLVQQILGVPQAPRRRLGDETEDTDLSFDAFRLADLL